MWMSPGRHESFAGGAKLSRPFTRRAPLAQEFSIPVEDDHAVIPIPIGDVYTAAFIRHRIWSGVNPKIGRLIEKRLTAVKGAFFTAGWVAGFRGSVGRAIALPLDPDCQQDFLPPVVILHRDSVLYAGNPDIIFIVHKATMSHFRQYLGPVAVFTVLAPAIDDVTLRVIDNDVRRDHP